MRWTGGVAGKRMEEEWIWGSGGQTSRNKTVFKTRHRWEDIIKIGVTKYGMGRHGQDISGSGYGLV
jgi:hypothetical protein